MSDLVESNIDQLVKIIKDDMQGMFGSSEMQQAGKKVYDIMYKNVKNRMMTTGYDYDQTGNFLEAMEDERKGFQPDNKTRNSITVGFGDIGEGQGLNDPRTGMREEQRYVTFYKKSRMLANGSIQPIFGFWTLKAETQMPKWIVLEFGTRDKADQIPSAFKVDYTPRPDRDVMFGPSVGKPDGNYKKKVFAMISKDELYETMGGDDHYNGKETMDTRPHPGTRPGRFFRNGLEDSKLPIQEAFGEGLQRYLDRLNS